MQNIRQATAGGTDGVASDGRSCLRLSGQEHPCLQVLQNCWSNIYQTNISWSSIWCYHICLDRTGVIKYSLASHIQVLMLLLAGTMSVSSSASQEKLLILSEHSGNSSKPQWQEFKKVLIRPELLEIFSLQVLQIQRCPHCGNHQHGKLRSKW